ncbi:hypothetical protein J4422_02840 [Candidatus Pacearchaeota archaeon]|nr:hypothetical protein [Candidatus Pacearchaeota archaeon]
MSDYLKKLDELKVSDYLKKLDELEGKKSSGKSAPFRKSYEGVSKRAASHIPSFYSEAKGYAHITGGIDGYLQIEGHALDEVDLRALARRTMEQAKEDSYISGAIYAAEIYAGLGKSHIALSKLMAVVEKAAKEGKAKPGDFEDVRYFVERMEREKQGKQQKPSGIEGRVGVFFASIIAGIAIGALSLKSTGNAIGTLGTTTGLLGVFLFIFGLAGMVFGRKK